MDTSPYLTGPYAPIADEVVADDLPVVGELPRDLDGAYVRNGPNPKHAPKGHYHWFDGDGMLHAIRFRDGKASYRNRWIRTEHLAREDEAGHALWTGLMASTKDNPPDAPYKDTANTDVVFHAGGLVASWYITGRPVRVDANTLDTLGVTDFGRGKPLRVSAHCKVDEQTGELMFFDYGPKPPFMRYGVVGADGVLESFEPIDIPGPRLPHDMAITENYSVLMDLPVFFSPKAIKERRWAVDFYRELPSRFGVVPRHGSGGDVKWFEAEPCYIYHTVNAWEEGSAIVMVGCRVDDPLPAVNPADGQWARMMANLRVKAKLHRWRFDLETGETTEETLDDRNTEFPTINAGQLGRPTRYAYNVGLDVERTMYFDAIVKYDTDAGTSARYDLPDGCMGSEAPFAPAVGGTEEDDGYVVSFVTDARTGASEVYVLDARDVAAGPIARVQLPQRVPNGFHACWVPGDAL